MKSAKVDILNFHFFLIIVFLKTFDPAIGQKIKQLILHRRVAQSRIWCQIFCPIAGGIVTGEKNRPKMPTFVALYRE
jgi:hypothetical protein